MSRSSKISARESRPDSARTQMEKAVVSVR